MLVLNQTYCLCFGLYAIRVFAHEISFVLTEAIASSLALVWHILESFLLLVENKSLILVSWLCTVKRTAISIRLNPLLGWTATVLPWSRSKTGIFLLSGRTAKHGTRLRAYLHVLLSSHLREVRWEAQSCLRMSLAWVVYPAHLLFSQLLSMILVCQLSLKRLVGSLATLPRFLLIRQQIMWCITSLTFALNCRNLLSWSVQQIWKELLARL